MEKLVYPYYSLYRPFDKKEIEKKIQNFVPIIYHTIPDEMKRYSNTIEHYNGKEYFLIKDDWKKNEDINNITDFFSEKVRIHCVFGKSLSPFEYWTKNKKFIISQAWKKYRKLSIYTLRETIFEHTKLCNNFRISVGMTVLNHFKAKRWLDISAGWGDRLLAGIFSKVKRYVSCDPNLDLHPCYEEMKNTFLSEKERNHFTIYPKGFEYIEEDLKNEKPFDIVFSSPPFFVLEKYSKYNNNSITKYGNEKIWVKEFFLKSLVICYNHLKKGGHIILYMGGSEYVFQQMHLLDKVMKYLGVIYFYDTRPRGMFVWKKIKNDKISVLSS